jgi:hypothetical protein
VRGFGLRLFDGVAFEQWQEHGETGSFADPFAFEIELSLRVGGVERRLLRHGSVSFTKRRTIADAAQ